MSPAQLWREGYSGRAPAVTCWPSAQLSLLNFTSLNAHKFKLGFSFATPVEYVWCHRCRQCEPTVAPAGGVACCTRGACAMTWEGGRCTGPEV